MRSRERVRPLRGTYGARRTVRAKSSEHVYTNVAGHGTAVMAAIEEKAPEAEYFAVRVFYTSLRTTADLLIRAIEWSLANDIDGINLSLGTRNQAHKERFTAVITRAMERGAILASAREADWNRLSREACPE